MTTPGLLTMSRKELDRAEWMLRIHERRTTQAEAAQRMGLSVRQIERPYRAYKAGGAAALVSKKRGRPSARRLPDVLRTEALALVREKYGDFGPTLACEKLAERPRAAMAMRRRKRARSRPAHLGCRPGDWGMASRSRA